MEEMCVALTEFSGWRRELGAVTDVAHLSLRRVTALAVFSVTDAGCCSDAAAFLHNPAGVIDRLVTMAAAEVLLAS